MKRFVVPPSWPTPPRRSWVPPKTWRPDPSWPPAPEGWRFWVDGKGKPVRGPIGQYGAPPRRVVYAGAAALTLMLGVSVWAVFASGLFNGKPDDSAAVKFLEDDAPSPSATPSTTTPVVPPKIVRVQPTTRPTQRPTQQPTQQPTPTRKPTATRTTERTQSTPEPTRTNTSTTPATPRPSTREELLQQYCIQRGLDPAWCDPSIWQTQHP